MLAMTRAVKGLGITPDIALIDGNKAPEIDGVKTQAVIKGDATSASIAAASILAKVARDRYMKAIPEKYPQYAFEKHKGYGTKLHNELILEHGPSEVHRKTFLRKLLNGK
jgi:ribonuclease HII